MQQSEKALANKCSFNDERVGAKQVIYGWLTI